MYPCIFFKQETSFWKACKKSICEVLHSSIRTKIKLSFLLLVGFISNIIVLRWLQVPVLKNSDFNIYLFRYLFHSYHFRIQFICTIFFWIFLYVLSLFFLVCILKMYEQDQETINFTLKKEDRPFFAYRISSLFKHSAKHVRRYFLEYYTQCPSPEDRDPHFMSAHAVGHVSIFKSKTAFGIHLGSLGIEETTCS